MKVRASTQLVQYEPAPGDAHAPMCTPMYQTATFEQPGAEELGAYDYSRSGNPTRAVLESLLADRKHARNRAPSASSATPTPEVA